MHPFTSVTVTVYVPALNPVAAEVEPPDGAQLKVYGEVPLDAVIVAVPLAPPLHEIFV